MERTQVKFFGPAHKKDLEIQINNYLKSKQTPNIVDVSFNVTRTLLPTGEFQQYWYGMVMENNEIEETKSNNM